jgi:hypothetical protein
VNLLKNCLHPQEAKIIAAMCWDYQSVPSKSFTEGAVHRAWLPSEIMFYSMKALHEKNISFKELKFKDSRWEPKSTIMRDGKVVANESINPSEKKKTHAWINAVLDWDEEKLSEASKDEEIVRLLTKLEFKKNEKRVEMSQEVMHEGNSLLELAGADDSVLDEMAENERKRRDLENIPKTPEEYKIWVDKQVSDLNDKIRSSGPKDKKRLSDEKNALVKAYDESMQKLKDDADHMALVKSGSLDHE